MCAIYYAHRSGTNGGIKVIHLKRPSEYVVVVTMLIAVLIVSVVLMFADLTKPNICDKYSYTPAPAVSPGKCAALQIKVDDKFSLTTTEGKIYKVELKTGMVDNEYGIVFVVHHPDYTKPFKYGVSNLLVTDTLYAVGDLILQRLQIGDQNLWYVRYPPEWSFSPG